MKSFDRLLIATFLSASTLAAVSPASAQVSENVCEDSSGHATMIVSLQNDIDIEVLDWGGEGSPLIFLTGFGNTAHVYDEFAQFFSPEFRVIAITRRGFGASSKPESGYGSVERSGDILGVMDSMRLRSATFAGHSLAGDELSYLGANHSDRVNGLIYLDAYDYGDEKLVEFESQVPPEVYSFDTSTSRDSLSVYHYQAQQVYSSGLHFPLTEICAQWKRDDNGKLLSSTGEPQRYFEEDFTHEAEFEKIEAPVLGIFASHSSILREDQRNSLTHEAQQRIADSERVMHHLIAEQIHRFQTRLSHRRVERIPDSNHYVFISNTRETVDLMMEFLASIDAD